MLLRCRNIQPAQSEYWCGQRARNTKGARFSAKLRPFLPNSDLVLLSVSYSFNLLELLNMSGIWIAFFVLLALLVLMVASIGMTVAKTYNRLVAMSNQAKNGFNQISVQLQRRYDLIPNLVEAVRGFMTHESQTLEAVIAARNQAASQLNQVASQPGNASAVTALAGAESALTGALGRMSFVMEDYPELKANESVAQLTEELTSTENRIAFARQSYNDWATAFNVMREAFPTNTFASQIGFSENMSLLEFEDQAEIKYAPKVSLV